MKNLAVSLTAILSLLLTQALWAHPADPQKRNPIDTAENYKNHCCAWYADMEKAQPICQRRAKRMYPGKKDLLSAISAFSCVNGLNKMETAAAFDFKKERARPTATVEDLPRGLSFEEDMDFEDFEDELEE